MMMDATCNGNWPLLGVIHGVTLANRAILVIPTHQVKTPWLPYDSFRILFVGVGLGLSKIYRLPSNPFNIRVP